jgi:hypothetical protein
MWNTLLTGCAQVCGSRPLPFTFAHPFGRREDTALNESARLAQPGDPRLLVGALRLLAVLALAEDEEADRLMLGARSAELAFALYRTVLPNSLPEKDGGAQLQQQRASLLRAHARPTRAGAIAGDAPSGPSREQLAVAGAAKAFLSILWEHERRTHSAHPLLTDAIRSAAPL